MNYIFNQYQTPINPLLLDKYPKEIQEKFINYVSNVPFIQSLIDPNRPYARDLERDDDGKIIVDITKPHILENMDYFRPSAIQYEQTGKYTSLIPNKNPNSAFGKWIREEIRRCYYGYVRPSDGEWITGDYYFFLNYCPIQIASTDESDTKEKKAAKRIIGFPHVWEGHYYLFHYLQQARNNGHHAFMLARRGAGKSFSAASLLAKRFVLGESEDVNEKVLSMVTANDKKYIQGGNKVLDMFVYYIDFIANHTEFPRRRLTNSLHDMKWCMGYIDAENGTRKGTLNETIGVTSKDNSDSLIGSRGQLYLLEEVGNFPNLLDLYARLRPSVEDGYNTFGIIFGYGTSGSEESDFSAAKEIMYNPQGYNMQEIPNVYDLEGKGRSEFTYFFPSYLNRANCYDKDGNSDIIKALLEILKDRYKVKYHTTDIKAITKRIAEYPITPAEAIMQANNNLFPVAELTERLMEIDNNPAFYNDTYIGELVQKEDGTIEYQQTYDMPIREYSRTKLKDNIQGALELFQLPEVDAKGKVFAERYIIGHDPVDNDESESTSLSSTFVFDLWKDTIVAEYTGRQKTADENFEILRKLCLFYNAKCLYESNIKGCFSYFKQKNCLHLLADTPDYLTDKEVVKDGFNNTSKGVRATLPINNYANKLIQQWLLKTFTKTEIKENGSTVEVEVMNLYNIKNRALLKELIGYNPEGNFDRIRALGLVMLYREEYMVRYQGNISREQEIPNNYVGNDKFFTDNYNSKDDNEDYQKLVKLLYGK